MVGGLSKKTQWSTPAGASPPLPTSSVGYEPSYPSCAAEAPQTQAHEYTSTQVSAGAHGTGREGGAWGMAEHGAGESQLLASTGPEPNMAAWIAWMSRWSGRGRHVEAASIGPHAVRGNRGTEDGARDWVGTDTCSLIYWPALPQLSSVQLLCRSADHMLKWLT